MKFLSSSSRFLDIKSRPVRALWIEISGWMIFQEQQICRGPRGPCGLKFNQIKERDADLDVEAREGLVD